MSAFDEFVTEAKDTLAVLTKGQGEHGEAIGQLTEKIKGLCETADEFKAYKSMADKRLEEARKALQVARMTGDASAIPPGRVFSPEKAKEFANTIIKLNKVAHGMEVKDFDFQTDPTGRALIPDTFHPELITIRERVGILQTLAREMPLGPGKNSWPRLTGGLSVSWTGWSKGLSETEAATGTVDLTPETVGGISLVPNQALTQVTVPLGEFLAEEFLRSLVKEEERVMIKGTGIPGDGKITGLLQSSDVTIVNMGSGDTAFSNLAYGDLVDLEANVVDVSLADARYLMSGYVVGLMKNLTDSQNRPIWQMPAGDQPDTVNGYPYTRSNQMPLLADSGVSTTFLAFGDFRMGLWYARGGTLAIDSSAHYKFGNNQTAFRMIEDFAAQVIAGTESGKNPIAVLKTAAS